MSTIDRRDFHRKLAATATAAGLSALETPAAPGDRRLGTCGPPPRKNPERQTAAESVPPLPLPAVPLRRSEPKAEPTPPMMIAKLEYGTTQDWNTDPGDLDNLMRHVRSSLGLWYGWKSLPLAELVATIQAGKKLQIPAVYLSGHDAFELKPAERQALVSYLHDGGSLIGDACCGQTPFAESFRSEVRAMFPDRAFEQLELDHPLFRAFYTYTALNYRDYRPGNKTEYAGPPRIEGLMLGCRTAVIFSPADMSCGWDEHTHERGVRMIPGDAIRFGINLVSYVAAMRQLAETQAVTREVAAPVNRPRQKFTLAQVRHHGDWNPDPNSTYQWLRHLAAESSLAVSFDLAYVDPTETKVAPYPFLYLTGFRDPRLSTDEIGAIRRHLQAGGFLFVNNPSGYAAFDKAARDLARALFPDQKLAPLEKDHPLYRALYTLEGAKDRKTGQPRPLELEGVSIKGRLVLAYSKADTVTHLKQISDPFGNGYDAETCRKLAVNVVAYAMQS